MSQQFNVQLGLCCMNISLRKNKPSIYSSRTIRLKQLDTQGIDELKRRANQNLDDLIKLIEWNEINNIKVFRLSSEIFPHISNPVVPFYGFEFAMQKLQQIGQLANKYGQRLTFHPGQYNVLGTPKRFILEKTIIELDLHAELLDLLEQEQNGVIVIHGGGVYGDKKSTMKRWVDNFSLLNIKTQKRLVLECCEKNYSCEDCLEISKMVFNQYGFYLPVVLDTHHYNCYTQLHPNEIQKPMVDLIPLVLDTWIKRNIKPKFHVSEQGSGRIGHHSDFIKVLPKELLEIPDKYKISIDIMIEAKMKEQAILKLYGIYPHLDKIISNTPNLDKLFTISI